MACGKLKFFLDEHIPAAVLPGLRRWDINVTSVDENHWKGTVDEDLAAIARSQRRVFVTMDADFLSIAKSGLDHPGIIFVSGDLTAGPILRALRFIHATTIEPQMCNKVEYASHFTDE